MINARQGKAESGLCIQRFLDSTIRGRDESRENVNFLIRFMNDCLPVTSHIAQRSKTKIKGIAKWLENRQLANLTT